MESSVLVTNTNLREHLERLQHRQKGGGGEASAAGCPFVLAPLLQTNRARLMSKYASASAAGAEQRVDRAHVARVRRSHREGHAHTHIYIYVCVEICRLISSLARVCDTLLRAYYYPTLLPGLCRIDTALTSSSSRCWWCVMYTHSCATFIYMCICL